MESKQLELTLDKEAFLGRRFRQRWTRFAGRLWMDEGNGIAAREPVDGVTLRASVSAFQNWNEPAEWMGLNGRRWVEASRMPLRMEDGQGNAYVWVDSDDDDEAMWRLEPLTGPTGGTVTVVDQADFFDGTPFTQLADAARLLESKAGVGDPPPLVIREPDFETFEDYSNHCEVFLDNLMALQAKKNADYTGDGELLANFRRAAQVTGTTVVQQILGRLMDKVSRVGALTQRPAKVESEPLVDAAGDLVAYGLLLHYATSLPYTLEDLTLPAE